MNLEEQINTAIKVAMLAKDSAKLEALRAIKSGVILLKTSGESHNEEAEIKMLQRLVKQRKESADIFIAQKREDLANVELMQASVIEAFLPTQLTEEELRNLVQEIINQLGAKTLGELGKVMGLASKQLSGKADGKAISSMVKSLLSN
jgi:uncharacterized protein